MKIIYVLAIHEFCQAQALPGRVLEITQEYLLKIQTLQKNVC